MLTGVHTDDQFYRSISLFFITVGSRSLFVLSQPSVSVLLQLLSEEELKDSSSVKMVISLDEEEVKPQLWLETSGFVVLPDVSTIKSGGVSE